MSTLVHIYGWFEPVKFECESDDPVIWVNQGADAVSLNLTGKQLDALEAAIAKARALLETSEQTA